ncbi:S8 family peptidase [Sphaerisporangium corydalis]|uniref:S8 family serine peptidase n=1 Tax=Sphaerisporangium corydalis TaxID=1441875 RepID=A0ABV9EM92_9ACTN|nr:S8 family peptidase [Sphaerisporangium corydalis]
MSIRPTPRSHTARWRGGLVVLGVLLLSGNLTMLAPGVRAGTPERSGPPPAGPPPPKIIPGQYIVKVRPTGQVGQLLTQAGIEPIFVYSRVLNGFAARLTGRQIINLLRTSDVYSIEEDGAIQELERSLPPEAAGGTGHAVPPARAVPTSSWGLDRIDQSALPLDGAYNVAHDGTGVTAYMLGSGIDPAHPEFAGRLIPGVTTVNDGHGTSDCLGRGTMVAGIVGGATWGVARNVHLSPVRVVDCDGRGSYSGLIAGMDWVASHARRPAVVNISVGGARSFAVNNAANTLAGLGVFIAAAAGDYAGDACDVSPAAALNVLAVAASTSEDIPAPGSDTGRCVGLYAPGSGVVSAAKGGGTERASGTAYAAPYVTGAAALFMQTHRDALPYIVNRWLTGNATFGALRDVPAGTINKLLFTDGL